MLPVIAHAFVLIMGHCVSFNCNAHFSRTLLLEALFDVTVSMVDS